MKHIIVTETQGTYLYAGTVVQKCDDYAAQKMIKQGKAELFDDASDADIKKYQEEGAKDKVAHERKKAAELKKLKSKVEALDKE